MQNAANAVTERIAKEVTAEAVAKIEAIVQSMDIDSNDNNGKQSPKEIEQQAQKVTDEALVLIRARILGNKIAKSFSKDELGDMIAKTEADAREKMNTKRRPNKLLQRERVAAAVARKAGRENKLLTREKETAAVARKAGRENKLLKREKEAAAKAAKQATSSTTSFTGTGRTVVRQASTGADDSQLRGRTRKRGNSVSRDRSRSREPRPKQRGDESDGTSGDRSDMGTSGDSSDSSDSGSSSDDDDSREKMIIPLCRDTSNHKIHQDMCNCT